MPATAEGYSGAMKRRFSIINFDKVFSGKKNTEIAKDMFEGDPMGVLAFALRGLERLVETNGGEYTSTDKSKDNVDKWTKKNDVIWSFLNDLQDEGIDVDGKPIVVDLVDDGKIKRNIIWQAFFKWQEINLDARSQLGKMNFLISLEDSGFHKRKSDGTWFIRGINVKSGENDNI